MSPSSHTAPRPQPAARAAIPRPAAITAGRPRHTRSHLAAPPPNRSADAAPPANRSTARASGGDQSGGGWGGRGRQRVARRVVMASAPGRQGPCPGSCLPAAREGRWRPGLQPPSPRTSPQPDPPGLEGPGRSSSRRSQAANPHPTPGRAAARAKGAKKHSVGTALSLFLDY